MAERHTAGMLALIPDNATELALDGGEPASELHLTLLHLGDDVTGWPDGQADRLRELITASAPALDAVEARVMGHAIFNPDGGPDGDRDPCAVYLVGDAPGLDTLRRWAMWTLETWDDYATPPEQHKPTIFHITGRYGGSVDELTYTGPVRFGALRLALADTVLDVPLGTDAVPVEGKSVTFTPPQDVRWAAVGIASETATRVIEGKALDQEDLEWVAEYCGGVGRQWAGEMLHRIEIKRAGGMDMGRVDDDGPLLESIEDLATAIEHHGSTPVAGRAARVRRLHRHAKRLGADHHVHARIDTLEGVSTDGSGAKWLPASGEILTEEQTRRAVEVKVMSPDPRAARLREYWAHGAGRAKWIGSPTPYRTLRRQLAKHVRSPRVLNGLVANVMKLATGIYPGQRKSLSAETVDEAALHAGVDEWGECFDEPWVPGYLAGLEATDVNDDLRADTDRLAALGATLVADRGPVEGGA